MDPTNEMLKDQEKAMVEARAEAIKNAFDQVCVERLAQIHAGSDAYDQHKAPNDWVAVIARHAGLAASDMTVPADIHRFKRQMVRVAATALAAIEYAEQRMPKEKVASFGREGSEGRGDAGVAEG